MRTETKNQTGLKPEQQVIGVGVLGWFRGERVTDRYGSVWLTIDGTEAPAKLQFPPAGQRGWLKALVIEPRKSDHIGDIFRGLRQRAMIPAGTIVTLGNGMSFKETQDGIDAIGTMPLKERESDWLDPQTLYNLHHSLVELIWEPDSKLPR